MFSPAFTRNISSRLRNWEVDDPAVDVLVDVVVDVAASGNTEGNVVDVVVDVVSEDLEVNIFRNLCFLLSLFE